MKFVLLAVHCSCSCPIHDHSVNSRLKCNLKFRAFLWYLTVLYLPEVTANLRLGLSDLDRSLIRN